jgi:two-component system, OmpR family, sensor kinase
MIERLPIRVRVTAAFALAMAVVLAATGLFLYLRLGSHLSASVDRDLRLRSQDLGALVRSPAASLAEEDAGAQVERGESYAELVDPRGVVLDSTQLLAHAPLLSPAETRAALRRPLFGERPTVPGLDERSRFLARRVTRDGRPLVLLVGQTLGDRAETLAHLRDELLIIGPIALVAASALGYLIAGLSLRPVERMRRRAAEISAATPGERLPVPPTGDELERLGVTLNEMLDRLEAALARERAFMADAGHELRTPLTHLRTELELAVRHASTPEELRETLVRSSEEAERLGRLADDLLLLARTDGGSLPLRVEDVPVDELFRSVATMFEWRAQELGRTVAAAPSGAHVRGDRLRLEQALANLVDNGLRHGGGAVLLSAAAANGSVELHVRDEGHGFPPAFLDRAFERFSRPDAARTGGGSGLGLSIVRTIAEAHGGSAGAANAPGADVWISLPQPG